MTDFLKEFQNTAFLLSPAVLAGVGFVFVWLGLCLWLGGLRWLKFLAGLIGVVGGYAATSIFAQNQLLFLIGVPAICGLIAVFLDKPAMILFSAAFIALLINLGIAGPTLADTKTWQNAPKSSIEKNTAVSSAQSVDILETNGRFVVETLRKTVTDLGPLAAAVAIVTALAIIGMGFVIPRLICAVTCSLLGVMAIAVGLILLLLYKGSKPIDFLVNQPDLFVFIIGLTTLFGILAQLALCPASPKKKALPATETKGDSL